MRYLIKGLFKVSINCVNLSPFFSSVVTVTGYSYGSIYTTGGDKYDVVWFPNCIWKWPHFMQNISASIHLHSGQLWTFLANHVIVAKSVDSYRRRLDKHWENELCFDYQSVSLG